MSVSVSAPRRSGSWPGLLRRLGTDLLRTPVLAVVLALLSWPVATLTETSFLVKSWPSALLLAFHAHVHWGAEVAYTYGPLGFLRRPLAYFPGETRLALLYVAATQVALSASLLYVLRRAFGVWAACGLTLLALCLVPDERAAAAVFVWAIVALRDDAPVWVRRLFLPAAGCAAALEMLVKANSGVVVLAVGVVVALARGDRVRNLLVLGAGCVASFLALWSLAGQRMGDIGSYLNGTKEIVAGYGPALGAADSDTLAGVIAALLAIALVFALARHARGTGRVHPAIYPLWGVVAFLLFKEGFVRSDTSHRPIFFGFVLCAALAVAALSRNLARALAITGAVALAVAWSYQGSPLSASAPAANLRSLVSEARSFVSNRSDAVQAARERAHLRAGYRLDARTIAEVGDRRMTIIPWEDAAAFAYRLRWQPLFSIQPSQAYTRWLDQRTARRLVARRGPERILRSPQITLDHRNTAWDMPAAMTTLLCRFAEISATANWEVLARAPNRCGRETTVATVRAGFGQRVVVPAPPAHAALLVRIHGAEPRGLETIQGLLYRPDPRYIAVRRHMFRLVSGTAADGLVLWVPAPDDYTGVFALSQHATTLMVRRGAGSQPSSDRLTYQFVALPIRPFSVG